MIFCFHSFLVHTLHVLALCRFVYVIRSKNAVVILASASPALNRLTSISRLNKCLSGIASSKPPLCSHSRHVRTRDASSKEVKDTGDWARASNSRTLSVVARPLMSVIPNRRHVSLKIPSASTLPSAKVFALMSMAGRPNRQRMRSHLHE